MSLVKNNKSMPWKMEMPHANDRWNDKDDCYLIDMWRELPHRELATEMGRSLMAITNRAQKLGLRGRGKGSV